MILAGLMGALSAAGGGTPTVTWGSIAYSAVNEGQQNTVNINLTYWDNTDVYWYLVDAGGSQISNSTQVTPNAGVLQSTGTGSSSQSFNFTFNNDATTDGELTYYVRIEDAFGTLLIPRQGPFTCNDTSLAPTYTLANGGSNTVNEGSEHTLNVGGTNVPGGTYYWTIETNSGDFATTSGSVTVNAGSGNNLGSFTVTPTADATTEGAETFTVSLRSGSITGTILATSQAANISDTSQGPTYSWGSYDTTVDEGGTLTVNVNTTNVSNSTTLYWNVVLDSTISSGDFALTSGSFSINSNTGAFNINPSSDFLTEGGELFRIQIRTGSNSGTVVLTSDQITISDTSAGNRAPIAYLFNGTGSYTRLDNLVVSNVSSEAFNSSTLVKITKTSTAYTPQVGWLLRLDPIDNWRSITNVADGGDTWDLTINPGGTGPASTTSQLSDNTNIDWALGTTWTIEFWVKPTVVPGRNGAPGTAQRILSVNTDLNVQNNYGYNNLDVCFTQGIIGIANQYAGFDAPAEMVGVWSHVAISSNAGHVRGFINGAQVYNNASLNINFTQGSADLYIGKNGTRSGANVNSFDGLLTDIRISNTARYTSAFNPATALAPTTDSSTKLLLTPKQDSWYGSADRRLGYNNFVTVDYPTLTQSLVFNGTDNRRVIVADNLADWDLGDNWTIEWWQKIPVGASGFLSVLCQDANVPTYSGIDVFINDGNIQMFNGNLQFSEAAATRGRWNHIAIQKNGTTLAAYINGVQQSVSGLHSGTIAPSSPLNVCIGSRTVDGGANFYSQYFNGELANIRISNVAIYSGTFTPPTTMAIDSSIKLSLDGSLVGSGMLTDEVARHTVTNNGAVIGYSSLT